MKIREFKNRFNYRPQLAGYVGVEREEYVRDKMGRIVPKAADVLRYASTFGIPYQRSQDDSGLVTGKYEHSTSEENEFGYELSACQIETRVGPLLLKDLRSELIRRQERLELVLNRLDLHPGFMEVGPVDMPLDVYPDPTGRYQKITKHMLLETLSAACRVIGTHVHIGMPDHETALKVYNYVIGYCSELCELGNGSFGERLAIYRQMAPNWDPPLYTSWEHFYEVACEQSFVNDPRKCWTLIRISVHGTIEFRMFGSTDSIDRIVSWAQKCHELCQQGLNHA